VWCGCMNGTMFTEFFCCCARLGYAGDSDGRDTRHGRNTLMLRIVAAEHRMWTQVQLEIGLSTAI
jgi:hypothetical protein